jgi:hypothetical protein
LHEQEEHVIGTAARQPGHRGRAALLWGVVFFVGGQLALTVVTERWRPELSDVEYGTRLAHLRQRLAEAPDRPLLLVLGSSRTGTGFRPDALPVYRSADGQSPIICNFALTGAGPLTELLCLRRLLSQNIRPRWVLVEVLGPVLHADGFLAEDRRIQPHRLFWFDLPLMARYADDGGEFLQRWLPPKMLPCFAERFTLLARFAPPWQTQQSPARAELDYFQRHLDPSGWLPHPPVSPEWSRRSLDAALSGYSPYFNQYRVSPLPDQALRELLDLCRREKIAVVLFNTPEASAFRSCYVTADTGWQLQAYLTGLSREYRIPWVNAQEWLTDDCFADGHHFLPTGATAFTERLGREVIQSLLEGKSLHHTLRRPSQR